MQNHASPETGSSVSDVLVVGGGIVGQSIALRLRARGLSVTLLDSGLPPPASGEQAYRGPASHCNAGHIATEQTVPITNPGFLLRAPGKLFVFGGPLDIAWRRPRAWAGWVRRALPACFSARRGEAALASLLAEAMPAWRRLAAELGMPGLVVEDGHLMLWRDGATGRRAASGWKARNTGTARASDLSHEEAARLQDLLGWRPAAGVSFRGTGQVRDLALLMNVLGKQLAASGVVVARGHAASLAVREGGIGATLDGGDEILGRRAVICAGAGSRKLLATFGLSLPVVAERGYFIEWDAASNDAWPPLVFEERAVIVTRFGARLRASSFVEFDDADAPPDPAKWSRLRRHVTELGFALPAEITQGMGARPTLPDYLPAIGAAPGQSRLIVATGHQHLGLTLAPLTSELATALLCGEQPAVELRAFDPGRFI